MACGMTDSPAEPSALTAKPLTARLAGVDLADVRSCGRELIRRIGVRVRDPDWGTVPPAIDGLTVEEDGATFGARHAREAIDFEWRAQIELEPRAVVYEMDGCAHADFAYNRIGLVVLHPPDATVGRRYRARTVDGEAIAGTLPELVAPQLIVEGVVQPLFQGFTQLEIEVEPGRWAAFEFEGDVFEMEDQRNWTDGSFKTYSTPVGLPVPRRASAGERIRQRLRAELPRLSRDRLRPAASARRAELRVGPPTGRAFPPLGICADGDGHDPAAEQVELLRGLGAAHLRVELQGQDWDRAFERGCRLATAMGAGLELALLLEPDEARAPEWLEPLGDALRTAAVPLCRVLVLRGGQRVTDAELAGAARGVLSLPGNVPLIGGTAAHFAELNRERPSEDAAWDGLAYSITPQVHDSDDESIMQTLPAQRHTVETARSFAGDRSIHVSPVSLRPRPNADPRQGSLLAAAWTAASAGQLAHGGVASATYYEATGRLGLMERSRPRTYPLYHVLRELCGWRAAELLGCRSTVPDRAEIFGVTSDAGVRLLALNLTSDRQRVSLGPLVCPSVARSALGSSQAADARIATNGGWLELELAPYEIARLRQL